MANGITRPKVSCVIPVYNEAKRVAGVLNVVLGHELIDEIIVINDGSTDESESLLKTIQGIKLISYPQNKGKSHAVMLGLKEAKHDFILMIDSDLVGLDKNCIAALMDPVIQNKADITISLRKNSLLIFKLFGLDFISGERFFRKAIIENVDDLDRIPAFGLEVYINRIIVRKKMRLKVVNWKNVITPRKFVKFGFWTGTKGDLKTFFHIVYFLGPIGAVMQFFRMFLLKK